MSQPKFEVREIGPRCYAIDDHGRTVAILTSQGYVDWLLRSPLQNGERVDALRKETHLSYTLGVKFLLNAPDPGAKLESISCTYRVEGDGTRVVLVGTSRSNDNASFIQTTAVLRTDEMMSEYEWDLQTTITRIAQSPARIESVEFNNVYAGKVGRCMLYAPQKEYQHTLMTDADGVIWRCPHQHLYHYGQAVPRLKFKEGTLAGFFGEPSGAVVVITSKSSGAPTWGICDMYFDLHCCATPNVELKPGESLHYEYQIKYLSRAEADAMLAKSKPVVLTSEERARHVYPRIELGLNRFDRVVKIDDVDDASGFRPKPPEKVWDREVGHSSKGSLRLTNTDATKELVWSAEPPTQIPPSTQLSINAMIKTQGVVGKGAYVRVRYHTFVWYPQPHCEWPITLITPPVNGTSDGWVKVTMPLLEVPPEHFDYLIWLEVVLEGAGTAWVTDVDVDLSPLETEPPAMEEGSSRKRGARVSTKATAGAGATA